MSLYIVIKHSTKDEPDLKYLSAFVSYVQSSALPTEWFFVCALQGINSVGSTVAFTLCTDLGSSVCWQRKTQPYSGRSLFNSRFICRLSPRNTGRQSLAILLLCDNFYGKTTFYIVKIRILFPKPLGCFAAADTLAIPFVVFTCNVFSYMCLKNGNIY